MSSLTACAGVIFMRAPGPPLLLIHGLMAYSFSWRFSMDALARHFSVYAVDLPGCGFSQRPDSSEWSLENDAAGVLRLMEHLGIEEADVLGTSRGGGVAIVLAALAAQRPMSTRVRRLMLVCSINPWSSYGQFLTRVLSMTIGGVFVVQVLPQVALDDAKVSSQTVWRSTPYCARHHRRLHRRSECVWKLRAHIAHRALVAS